jgi:heterogeneous nuclear rnp K-like protein
MSSDNTAKKRSRSPSDETPEKQHKRANTGASPIADDSAQFVSESSSSGPTINDVSMVDYNAPIGTTTDVPSVVEPLSAQPSAQRAKVEGDNDAAGTAASAVASSNASSPAVTAAPQTSTSASATTGNNSSRGPGTGGSSGGTSAQIHMRCLIVTQDASIIIGKGGSHVNEIREKSGARVMVSESIPGNPERILNVSGPLDAVSKVCFPLSHFLYAVSVKFTQQAFGLIVRRINDEPFDVPSVPGSRAVTIKFMIPNSRMGSVIGKQGTKIKEIQDASGARLNASEGMLPGSTEVSTCRIFSNTLPISS